NGVDRALDAAELSAVSDQAVAKICGIDLARLAEFYSLFAVNERVVTAFSQGVNQSSAGTDKVNSIINCHLITGRVGRPAMGSRRAAGNGSVLADGAAQCHGRARSRRHVDHACRPYGSGKSESPVHRASVLEEPSDCQ